MEIKISTQQILNVLHVISWIVFAGLGIQAGAVIVNAIVTAFADPSVAVKLWKEVDLSALYDYDHGYFLVEMFFISIVTMMKATIFYLIIMILHKKKLNMSEPFNKETGRLILMISYLAFFISMFSAWGMKYAEWFETNGVKMPDAEHLHLDGADVWLFMAVILFVVSQIFKRGIEIQEENELTV